MTSLCLTRHGRGPSRVEGRAGSRKVRSLTGAVRKDRAAWTCPLGERTYPEPLPHGRGSEIRGEPLPYGRGSDKRRGGRTQIRCLTLDIEYDVEGRGRVIGMGPSLPLGL